MAAPTPEPSEKNARPAWLLPGLQLALAVLLAWALSQAVGLPEGTWAVMSALIVARPHAGAALVAGWDRVKGTLIGCLLGGATLLVLPHALAAGAAGVALVAAAAFVSAARPGWRSAPIAALIVVSAGGVAGASGRVAALRGAEVLLGVVAALAVSLLMPASRSGPTFERLLGELLAALAAQLRRAAAGDERSAEEREAEAQAQRAALRRLGETALGADHERRVFTFRRKAKSDAHHRQALLAGRIAQDVATIARTVASVPALRSEAAAALAQSALALEQAVIPEPPPAGSAKGTALGLPLAWLAEDLGRLRRLRGGA